MKSKSKLWFALVVILGIATGFLVYRYLTEMQAADQGGINMTSQVVARIGIPAGTKITSDMLDVTQVPSQYVHRSALNDKSSAVGLFAIADMVSGETVLASKVSSEKTTNELQYKVPEGYRAITVPVNSLTGVAGHVKPGHYVDVLAVHTTTEKIVDSRVYTILQRILVLAVGPDLQKREGAQAVDNVTLAVKPDDAQTVALATTVGKVVLTLRPVGDNSELSLGAINLSNLQSMNP